MQRHGIVESFNAAIEGFIYVLKSQRNMRIHFLLGVLFLLIGIYLNFGRFELIALGVTISLVLLTEMINTSIELIMDLVAPNFNPVARIIKDISAGAVMVASLNAVIVGYLLFFKPMVGKDLGLAIRAIKGSQWHVSFICLIVVIGMVITGKLFFHRGTPLRGGMPSGHSAIAFSIWTIAAFVTANELVIFLVLLLAILVAQSRVETKIHTVWDVVVGGLLGISLTTFIFQLIG